MENHRTEGVSVMAGRVFGAGCGRGLFAASMRVGSQEPRQTIGRPRRALCHLTKIGQVEDVGPTQLGRPTACARELSDHASGRVLQKVFFCVSDRRVRSIAMCHYVFDPGLLSVCPCGTELDRWDGQGVASLMG